MSELESITILHLITNLQLMVILVLLVAHTADQWCMHTWLIDRWQPKVEEEEEEVAEAETEEEVPEAEEGEEENPPDSFHMQE